MEKTIIHIITRLIHGGADQNTIESCAGLARRGWGVILVVGAEVTISLDEVEKAGVKVLRVNSLLRNISVFNDLKSIVTFYRICREQKPLIVHTHTAKGGIVGRIGAWLAGVDCIIHAVHGSPFDTLDSNWKIKLLSFVERKTTVLNKYYTAVGRETFEKYCKQIGLGAIEVFQIVRSAIDGQKFNISEKFRDEYRKKLGLNANIIAICMVARITPKKGYDYYIELCRKLCVDYKNFRFYAIGEVEDEDYYSSIKNIAGDMLNKDIIFLDRITHADMPAFLSAIDIIVHTSLAEGLPKVIAESLIARKPVISFKVEGVGEIIEEGVNGFIVPIGDLEALKNRVLDLAKLDGIERFKINAEPYNKKVEEEFSLTNMINNLEYAYSKALKRL
jgi:glycosyltransferase involved in cell wall biosynthesis